MSVSSISNRKLHCCLLVLILFLVTFLLVPLLLISMEYSAFKDKGRAEEDRNQDRKVAFELPQDEMDEITPVLYQMSEQELRDINCTDYALRANLTLAKNLQCPSGFFPCRNVCPEICLHQGQNCDKRIAHCPDGSDEINCDDDSGILSEINERISKSLEENRGLGYRETHTIPDSCSDELFKAHSCPCNVSDTHAILCDRLNLTQIPPTIAASVVKIRVVNNEISSIRGVNWPRPLRNLILSGNQLTYIGAGTFKSAPNLKSINFNYNRISFIDERAFEGALALSRLEMENNSMLTFNSSVLNYTPKLDILHLSANMIDLPEQTSFSSCCQKLRHLFLEHNRLSLIRSHWFSNMTSLEWLSLRDNQIGHIEAGSFDQNYRLLELNLGSNRIKQISRHMFAYNLNIEKLYLDENGDIKSLPKDAFSELRELESLNLEGILFARNGLEKGTFKRPLTYIYFEKFRYCHYASEVRVCRPQSNGLSSTTELLALPILKDAVWIVAIVCSLGNVFVFIWRTVSTHEHASLSLFVRMLSIADLMMGLYLGAIAHQDSQFEQKFGQHAVDWNSSGYCAAIGFMAILSSELSVFILTIITVERYRSIMSKRRLDEKHQKRRAWLYMALAWLLSILIASYPLLGWLTDRSDSFTAINELCLPLYIEDPHSPGYLYSALVYIGINLSAVLLMIGLYIRMYARIMKDRKQSKPAPSKSVKREDAILALRFVFIVIVDCLCWIPIVVIKILAYFNWRIPSGIHGGLVVFIFPINSALNPIVYTLAAPTSLRAAGCRLFKRLCDRIDRITGAGCCNGGGRGGCGCIKSSSNHGSSAGGCGGGGGGSNGSHYSSQSSTASAALGQIADALAERGRRKNTGSTNSTTFLDTFEASTTTTNTCFHSKPSLESALISYDFPQQQQHNGCRASGPETAYTLKAGANDLTAAAALLKSTSAGHGCQPGAKPAAMAVRLAAGCDLLNGAAALGSMDLECCNSSGNSSQLAAIKLDGLSYHHHAILTGDERCLTDSSDSSATDRLRRQDCSDLSTCDDSIVGAPPPLPPANNGPPPLVGDDRRKAGSGNVAATAAAVRSAEKRPASQRRANNAGRRQRRAVLARARPDGGGGGGVSNPAKALDPPQLRRSTMDSTVLSSSTEAATLDGRQVMTTASLDLLQEQQRQQEKVQPTATSRARQSRVSFSSKDSETCLLVSSSEQCC